MSLTKNNINQNKKSNGGRKEQKKLKDVQKRRTNYKMTNINICVSNYFNIDGLN